MLIILRDCNILYSNQTIVRKNAEAKLQVSKHRTRPIQKHSGTVCLTNLHVRGGAKGRRKSTCSIFTFYLGTSEKTVFKRLHNNKVSIQIIY